MSDTASRSRTTSALAAKGFRPFFLLAAIFATAMVPLWLFTFFGVLRPGSHLEPTVWHAHEMVFGFAVAVIAGFLLTSVSNWTKRETATGAPLMALAALWVAGRVVMSLPHVLPHLLVAIVDLAFLPMLMIALGRPLLATRNRRNFVMLVVLGALFLANLTIHVAALRDVFGLGRRSVLVAIDVVVLLILVIAGRVVPMFTRNATGIASVRSSPVLDRLALVCMGLLVVVDAALPDSRAATVLAGATGIFAAARAARWGAWASRKTPLLWILHVGYAWIPLGLLLRVAATITSVSTSAATHALTVGAIGSLTLGMMARVTLGHTGRALVASKLAAVSFATMTFAAVVRVLLPLVVPAWYGSSLIVAACLWSASFALYLVTSAPMLIAPRVDGKPG